MKVVAIIQARMGSSRLPGKVLRTLGNRVVLDHVVTRVRSVEGVSQTIVATTTLPADDVLAARAVDYGATVFRGSETDVLDRYHGAALAAEAEIVVRITSDCPLVDAALVADMLVRFTDSLTSMEPPHYMSNGLRRTFPRGLDAEIFTMEALGRAHAEARLPYEREHVTPYLYQHPEKFRVVSHEGKRDLSHLRWTLDTIDDLSMLSRIFDGFLPDVPRDTEEVIAFLDAHPEVAAINASVTQKALGQ
jgi:spore coat polysaccharide biosynthesis protein SpsF